MAANSVIKSYELDADGQMKVEINGAIHRRPARIIEWGFSDGQRLQLAKPELRAGEILIERIGMMPAIVRSGLQ